MRYPFLKELFFVFTATAGLKYGFCLLFTVRRILKKFNRQRERLEGVFGFKQNQGKRTKESGKLRGNNGTLAGEMPRR